MKNALYWDIENISAKYVFTRLGNKDIFSKKIIFHHDENLPYSENDFKALNKRGYQIKKTSYFKNSADLALIKEIEEDIVFFDSFYIISNDFIFAEIIVKLLKLEKSVFLFTKKRNDNLKLIKNIKELLGFNYLHLFKNLERI